MLQAVCLFILFHSRAALPLQRGPDLAHSLYTVERIFFLRNDTCQTELCLSLLHTDKHIFDLNINLDRY